MKILIIGNGFDLAHGLPTKYTDFLQICSIVKTAKVSWIDNEASISSDLLLSRSDSGEDEFISAEAVNVIA